MQVVLQWLVHIENLVMAKRRLFITANHSLIVAPGFNVTRN